MVYSCNPTNWLYRCCVAILSLLSANSSAQSYRLHVDTIVPLASAKSIDTLQIALPDSLDGCRWVENAPWNKVKHPWRAAAQVVGINASLLAFDYYVLHANFAKVTNRTLKRNLKLNQWFWDADVFHTNMFFHPYHGNLFFNAARSNGMNFWQSIPYTFAGDMLWEMAGENELPSINDALSTGIGGLAIGECTYRLSSIVYDQRLQGWSRVMREILGAAINPIRGLNRVITGEAWKVRQKHYLYHDVSRFPVRLSFSVGGRYVDTRHNATGEFTSPYVHFEVEYGDAFGQETQPYDYFKTDVALVLGHQQEIVNHLQILGQLFATSVLDTKGMQTRFGLYQHFNYDNANERHGGIPPYQLSEAASVGIGWMCRIPSKAKKVAFQQSVFLNAMLLGGAWSDYLGEPYHRTYNMGSGFTAYSFTSLHLPRQCSLSFDTRFFRMYSWRGYEEVPAGTPHEEFSAQGEHSQTSVWMLRPTFKLPLWKQWGLQLSGAYYHRATHYKYHPDAKATTYEWRMGLLYQLPR